VLHAEKVLGVSGGVVGAAARRDQGEPRLRRPDLRRDRLDPAALARDQGGNDLGLLPDLMLECSRHTTTVTRSLQPS